MRAALPTLLVVAAACGGRGPLETAGARGTGGGGAGGATGTGALPSCAFTAEPAQAPVCQYVGVEGDLAACGIDGTPGPLPAAVCRAEGCSGTCSLIVDAGLGLGPAVVACGCATGH